MDQTPIKSHCEKCGAELAEGNAFCTICGVPRSDVPDGASFQRSCERCGARLTATSFCSNCGAPTGKLPVGVISADGDSVTAAAAGTANGPGPVLQSRRHGKFVFAAAALVLLLIVAIIAVKEHRTGQRSEKEARAAAGSGTPDSTSGRSPSEIRRDSFKAIDAVGEQVNELIKNSAGDAKTYTALSDLRSRVDKLTYAVESNHIPDDLDKQLSDIRAAAAQFAPAITAATAGALSPPPIPSGPPMVPVAGTGDPKHDWPLEYERTVAGPEADLVVRTGDINNLGFDWPAGFDPFSGDSTPAHPWPSILQIPPHAPPGTDRIIIGTGVTPVHMHVEHAAGKPDRIMIDAVTPTVPGDGYSSTLETCYALRTGIPAAWIDKATGHVQPPPNEKDSLLQASTEWAASCTRQRALTMPAPIVLAVGELPAKIDKVVVQIFADDFQAPSHHSYFQVSLNGTRIPAFEDVLNSLDQTGPIGKLVSMNLLPEYWPLLKSGSVSLLIDDPTTHAQDGYAVDFVRILVNPHKFKYQVSLTANVTDADTHKPIPGATVSVGTASVITNQQGKCEFKGIPAGLVVPTANAPGYDQNSVPVDLPAGQSGNADIRLHPHQESTAALEHSVAQTGSATVYGIHFDTGASKLRGDSMPALNAILGLINGRPGSAWIIAGHTDNQGSDALNIPLSKARAASVIAWLTARGIAADRLQSQGFGSTRPVADNATAGGRALNRRVEVSLAK